jgi:hypothetical protein
MNQAATERDAHWIDRMMDRLSKELLGSRGRARLSPARFRELASAFATPLGPREMIRISDRASRLLASLSKERPRNGAAIVQLGELVKRLRFRPLDLAEHARRKAARAQRVLGGGRRELPRSNAPAGGSKWWALRSTTQPGSFVNPSHLTKEN